MTSPQGTTLQPQSSECHRNWWHFVVVAFAAGLGLTALGFWTTPAVHPKDLEEAFDWATTAMHEKRPDRALKLIERLPDLTHYQERIARSTLLHKASTVGCVPVALRLLDLGADVRHATSIGETPLDLAAAYGRTDVVRLLLDRGAEINRRRVERSGPRPADEWYGLSPLDRAAWNGHLEVVQVLLERGAKTDRNPRDGRTALYYACSGGLWHPDPTDPLPQSNRHVIELLIKHGCDVNCRDWVLRRTPLMLAIRGVCTDTVEYLVERGDVQVNLYDLANRTALDWAIAADSACGDDRMQRILRAHGAKTFAELMADANRPREEPEKKGPKAPVY